MHRLALAALLCLALPCATASIVTEDLEGPPVLTARSWAIADAGSGEILWAHLPDEPRKAASTTKIMAAYVVLELAAADPRVLDEWIDVSDPAAATTGSRAGLVAGDRVQVRDGLYALMLPSGNDMGNAIAEHFHDRLGPPGEETPEGALTPANASRQNFIAEMNRTARRLGMAGTRYRISYGDGGGDEDRTTTARDLVTLAMAARRHDLFRRIVGTAEHAIQVRQPDGTTRELSWKNTNRLLEISGYQGTKTGSTAKAGYCLVAEGRRQDTSLVVVTLGSTSEESRFADSRNLFRWAWTRGDHDRKK